MVDLRSGFSKTMSVELALLTTVELTLCTIDVCVSRCHGAKVTPDIEPTRKRVSTSSLQLTSLLYPHSKFAVMWKAPRKLALVSCLASSLDARLERVNSESTPRSS
jgi:hypothetical protein